MKKDRTKLSVYHLWRAIYPMPLYQLIQGLVLSAAVFFLFSIGIGDGSLTTLMKVFPDITVVYLMISGVLSILLFGWIYHRDVQERKNRAIWEEHTHLGAGTILLIMLGGAGVALAGNQLVNLTPLMELSENYVETSEALSAGNAWLELFCVGVLMPVAEEVVMRGLVYGRLRDMMRPLPAILWKSGAGSLCHGLRHLPGLDHGTVPHDQSNCGGTYCCKCVHHDPVGYGILSGTVCEQCQVLGVDRYWCDCTGCCNMEAERRI